MTDQPEIDHQALSAWLNMFAPDDDSALPVDAYYDADRSRYLMRNSGGRWLSLGEAQFKRYLASLGFSPKPGDGDGMLSPADAVIVAIQDRRDIRYAAPLAGYRQGFYQQNGARILVTESPRLTQAQAGDWHTLQAVFEGLFLTSEPDCGTTQLYIFYGWLKMAILALRSGTFQPGQALAIAGPADCGKSLLQNLITEILGGRCAKASAFMMGKTTFNGDLFEAEHLMLEDEHMSTRIGDRLAFGAAIKNLCVNQTHACHHKHRQAITLRPFWRVTISLNDDPEALMVLPPLDAHIADKITILKASRFEMPMETCTIAERENFWNTLITELSAFVAWLISDFQLPPSLIDRRYGVSTWHHPKLKDTVSELAPERLLLQLIDDAVFNDSCNEWQGTSAQLRAELLQQPAVAKEARRLLSWPNACGTYLGRLEIDCPERVRQQRTAKERLWVLRANSTGMTQ